MLAAVGALQGVVAGEGLLHRLVEGVVQEVEILVVGEVEGVGEGLEAVVGLEGVPVAGTVDE